MIKRYIKYAVFLVMIVAYSVGMAMITGDLLGFVAYILPLFVVLFIFWRKRRKGEEWNLFEVAFEDTMVKIYEPEGMSVGLLVLRTWQRERILRKLCAALRDLALEEPERANLLVVLAIACDILPMAWRPRLEQNLEHLTVDEIKVLNFGPSHSIDLEPFRAKESYKGATLARTRVALERLIEPIDAQLAPKRQMEQETKSLSDTEMPSV